MQDNHEPGAENTPTNQADRPSAKRKVNPALVPLIQYLARIAVRDYLAEVRGTGSTKPIE